MARRIEEIYNHFEAFIVICGLDVISYISTFLSFMLENLSKLVEG